MKDRDIWLANQENLSRLSEDFNFHAGQVREDKDLVEGSLQRIQKELDQSKVTFTETLQLTRATVDEQTRRLDEHDTKLQLQQDASFFGSTKESCYELIQFKYN
ncbi:hypothetical protein ACLB2K_012008 [Fragaria x ananassa]